MTDSFGLHLLISLFKNKNSSWKASVCHLFTVLYKEPGGHTRPTCPLSAEAFSAHDSEEISVKTPDTKRGLMSQQRPGSSSLQGKMQTEFST